MVEKIWKGDSQQRSACSCISLAYRIVIHYNYICSWLATATAFCAWANSQHNEGCRAELTAKLWKRYAKSPKSQSKWLRH
jgi:hypothetical protein